MLKPDGLICAFHVSQKGTVRPLGWKDLASDRRRTGWTWVHLDRAQPAAREWLKTGAGLKDHIAETLLFSENRPHCEFTTDGTMLILRGVNLNPDSKPEDMVAVRVWIEPHRVITTRNRRILAIKDIRDGVVRGDVPPTVGDFICELSSQLVRRMGPVISDLDDTMDRLEDASRQALAGEARNKLARLRRRVILMRRFLAPQRDGLSKLAVSRAPFLDDYQRELLREVIDHVSRLVEELDALRERAAVIQDQVSTRLAEQTNAAMFRLSIIATIFLPLSLLTGLLGVNVAGMPGQEQPWAFWAVCAILLVMAGGTVWLLKYLESR